MQVKSLPCILLAASVAQAQGPASVHTSNDLGFSIALPSGWEMMETSALAEERAREYAKTEEGKRRLGCVQVGLTARVRGNPADLVLSSIPAGFSCTSTR